MTTCEMWLARTGLVSGIVLTMFVIVLAGCTSDAYVDYTLPATTDMQAATAAPSTSVPGSTTGVPPSWSKVLVMTPDSGGQPAEPWEVCGRFAPNREVQIVMYLPDTNLVWVADDVVTIVETAADGRFCWKGAFPTQLVDAMTGGVVPIEPGWYEMVARHNTTGQAFTLARVRIRTP